MYSGFTCGHCKQFQLDFRFIIKGKGTLCVALVFRSPSPNSPLTFFHKHSNNRCLFCMLIMLCHCLCLRGWVCVLCVSLLWVCACCVCVSYVFVFVPCVCCLFCFVCFAMLYCHFHVFAYSINATGQHTHISQLLLPLLPLPFPPLSPPLCLSQWLVDSMILTFVFGCRSACKWC